MATPILVTGGAGYIGSHTAKALSRAGFDVVTYDNLVYGHPWAVRWGPLVPGELADRPKVAAVFEKYRPEAVIHFAAYTYVGESVTNPSRYYNNNVMGTISLLDAMRDFGCGRIVFSSTCAVYGQPNQVPIPETHPLWPANPYGWSKFVSEQALADYETAHGIRHAALRYFNAAGADGDGQLGEVHDPETHLIPLVAYAALGRRECIHVFGTDYDTPDGTALRDYVHVEDLATAHVLAVQRLLDGGDSLSVNLGTGRSHSVLEVIEAVKRASGRDVPTRFSGRRAGDVPVLTALSGAAKDKLGWTCARPGLDDIVASAWNWHANHQDRVMAGSRQASDTTLRSKNGK